MRILVTGATGFIGNHIVNYLLENNHQVIATSLNESKATQFHWFNEVEYVPFDINIDSEIFLADYFKHPDAVIHLAWQGLPNYKSLFHFEQGLFYQYSFIKNLVTSGIKDITITGTCFEYGMKEGELNEGMMPEPANPYALAKDSLRKFVVELQKVDPFILKWVRLFYMYGKGQSENSLISKLESAISNGDEVFNMSGGEQQRDYLPVERVAEYVVNIATQKEVTGVINCCSNSPIKIKDFVADFLKKTGKSITLNLGYYPYPDYEPMNFWGDNTKLKSIIGR